MPTTRAVQDGLALGAGLLQLLFQLLARRDVHDHPDGALPQVAAGSRPCPTATPRSACRPRAASAARSRTPGRAPRWPPPRRRRAGTARARGRTAPSTCSAWPCAPKMSSIALLAQRKRPSGVRKAMPTIELSRMISRSSSTVPQPVLRLAERLHHRVLGGDARLRLLLEAARHVDAVGQRERQQHHLQRRADQQRVRRERVGGQHPRVVQGQRHHADQQHGPGREESPRARRTRAGC